MLTDRPPRNGACAICGDDPGHCLPPLLCLEIPQSNCRRISSTTRLSWLPSPTNISPTTTTNRRLQNTEFEVVGSRPNGSLKPITVRRCIPNVVLSPAGSVLCELFFNAYAFGSHERNRAGHSASRIHTTSANTRVDSARHVSTSELISFYETPIKCSH